MANKSEPLTPPQYNVTPPLPRQVIDQELEGI